MRQFLKNMQLVGILTFFAGSATATATEPESNWQLWSSEPIPYSIKESFDNKVVKLSATIANNTKKWLNCHINLSVIWESQESLPGRDPTTVEETVTFDLIIRPERTKSIEDSYYLEEDTPGFKFSSSQMKASCLAWMDDSIPEVASGQNPEVEAVSICNPKKEDCTPLCTMASEDEFLCKEEK